MKILFLHGWQSTPGGVKPTYLKDHGHEVLNPALPDDDFDAAMRIAQAEFDSGKPDVVVGSSRGGAVAMNIDTGSVPLVLLCPAWKRWGTATTVKPGTVILHSQTDEVVPFADSEELVRNSSLPSESLIEIGTDHRLADPESLAKILEVVERTRRRGRQFSVGTLLVIMTMYAVLFAAIRAIAPPQAAWQGFILIALFLTTFGLGRIFLFKGKHPRKASAIIGCCWWSCLAIIGNWDMLVMWVNHGLFPFIIPYFAFMLLNGALAGLIFGALIAGVFRLLDKLRSLLDPRNR